MNKKLQKLKEVNWKTKGGKVLKETALISEAVAEWVPGAGLIKYAANKGADMLVPPVTNEQLLELLEELQSVPHSLTNVRNNIEEQIQLLREKLNLPEMPRSTPPTPLTSPLLTSSRIGRPPQEQSRVPPAGKKISPITKSYISMKCHFLFW